MVFFMYIPTPNLPDPKNIYLEGIKKNTESIKNEIEKERQERIEADKRNLRRSIFAGTVSGVLSTLIVNVLIFLSKLV